MKIVELILEAILLRNVLKEEDTGAVCRVVMLTVVFVILVQGVAGVLPVVAVAVITVLRVAAAVSPWTRAVVLVNVPAVAGAVIS